MSGILEKIGIKHKDKAKKKGKSAKTKKTIGRKAANGKKIKTARKERTPSKKKPSVKAEKAKVRKTGKVSPKSATGAYLNILKKIETEKSNDMMAKGKYLFVVSENANKAEIKKAIQRYYNVDVKKVNIMNYKPKKKRFGMTMGEVKGFKKAVVTLPEGQTIEV